MTLSRHALKSISRLKQKKYRIAERKFLVEGVRLVTEALQSDWHVDKIIVTHTFEKHKLATTVENIARKKGINMFAVSVKDFKKIADTVTSQGIAAVVSNKDLGDILPRLLESRERCFFIAIETLQDPGNLGTIIRTGAWFGVDAVIHGPECVAWHNPKTLRASMGAIFHIPVIALNDFHDFLSLAKTHNAMIYLADQGSNVSYTEINYAPKKVLLIGHETDGVSNTCKALADSGIAIHSKGSGESLNAAMATGILLAEMLRESKTTTATPK